MSPGKGIRPSWMISETVALHVDPVNLLDHTGDLVDVDRLRLGVALRASVAERSAGDGFGRADLPDLDPTLVPERPNLGLPRFLVNDERMSSNSAWDTSRRLGLLPADPGGCSLSSSNA
jgi:hypothetical protein